MKSKIVLITGGSASGKTTLAVQIKENLGDRAVLISQDSFYKPTGVRNTNFDSPNAFDFAAQKKALLTLRNKRVAKIPIYDFEKNDIVGFTKIKSAPLIIFEGLFTFHDKELAEMSDFKIFVDTPSDTRLARRILRDVKERDRTVENVIKRWINDVQPSYVKHIAKARTTADIIIPWNTIKERAVRALLVTFSNILED